MKKPPNRWCDRGFFHAHPARTPTAGGRLAAQQLLLLFSSRSGSRGSGSGFFSSALGSFSSSRSGFGSSRSGSRGFSSGSGSRSSSRRFSGRSSSRGRCGFFLLAAGGQGCSGDHGGENQRLVHCKFP